MKSNVLHEQQFSCPYCGESITVLLDLSIEEQDYIEDCEVCCRPIEIHYEAQDAHVTYFWASTGE
ncbi:MAG: CPXCG motif-containing cysteine-rich protein [Proteobacteria bacterium]|nr:CPXCG motif-containing cysteine-rich protein [Pseudomonadota bacterium]